MGVRIGQDPFDALVIQEMLHDVKPDLIIETGTNSGGGALYMAVMMEAINPACKIFTMDTTPIEAWMKRFDGREQGGQVSTKRIAGGEAEDEELRAAPSTAEPHAQVGGIVAGGERVAVDVSADRGRLGQGTHGDRQSHSAMHLP